MRLRYVGGLVLLLVLVGSGQAQITGKNDTCRQSFSNRSGTAKADIAVPVTAVTVIAANQKLCAGLIENKGTVAIRCMSIADGTPTGTTGLYVPASATLVLDFDAQPGWKCIRDTSAGGDSTVSTLEREP